MSGFLRTFPRATRGTLNVGTQVHFGQSGSAGCRLSETLVVVCGLFHMVSMYSVFNDYELLADEVDRVGAIRFLFGDPSSVAYLDPGKKDHRSFDLVEGAWLPCTVEFDHRTLASLSALATPSR